MLIFYQTQLDEGVRIVNRTSFILAILLTFAVNGTVFAADSTMIESSIQTFTQEINANPDAALAYSNRASMKFLKKDTQGAIADFDKAIQINPNNPELYLNRGYIKQVINDLQGAMADYNSALKVNPNFSFAFNNRGVLKVALKDIQGAMDDYAKALQLNPRYSDVYYNRANLRYMLGDNNGALEDYNKAIEINPKDAEAYNNRGVVKKRMNFNVGALSDYTQAIALNPKDSIAYANRGRLKKLYFDNEGAAIDLDQAVALAEKQVFIKNVKPLLSKESYVAAIPVVQGITDDVIAPIIKNPEKQPERIAYNSVSKPAFKSPAAPVKSMVSNVVKSADTKPSSTVLSAGIGKVQATSGSSVTTTVVKNSPTTNVKLAESYYIRGLQKCVLRDLQGAIADLNKAIENNSNYADAYYYRAAIRKELGDSEGFKKDYTKAIQINPSLQAFNDSNCLSLISG